MATEIPHGWSVGYGAWDTDIELSTAQYHSGNSSIHFLSTTPASDPYMAGELLPTEPNTPWAVEAWVRSSTGSGSPTNTIWVTVVWYDTTGTYLSSSDITVAACASATTWEPRSGVVTAPASTAFAQVIFGKHPHAFEAWVDGCDIKPIAPAFFAYSSAGGSAASGSAIECDTEIYDFGSWFDNVTNYSAIVPVSGVYRFVGCVAATADIGVNEYIAPFIIGSPPVFNSIGAKVYSVDGNEVYSQVVLEAYFEKGAEVLFSWFNNHSGALAYAGESSGVYYTSFAGSRVN